MTPFPRSPDLSWPDVGPLRSAVGRWARRGGQALAAGLGRLWRAVRGFLPGVLDLHLYGGGALVAYGVYRVWEPGAYMTGGLLLLAIAVWRIRRMSGGSS